MRVLVIEDNTMLANSLRQGFQEEGFAVNVPREMVSVQSQMSALSYRIQALEDDPINRGYTFLGSENAQLRLEGINSLRRLAQFDPAAREAVRNMLNDPSERVSEEAADVLGRLNAREGTDALLRALNDPNNDVREEAIASLGEIGAVEAVPLACALVGISSSVASASNKVYN